MCVDQLQHQFPRLLRLDTLSWNYSHIILISLDMNAISRCAGNKMFVAEQKVFNWIHLWVFFVFVFSVSASSRGGEKSLLQQKQTVLHFTWTFRKCQGWVWTVQGLKWRLGSEVVVGPHYKPGWQKKQHLTWHPDSRAIPGLYLPLKQRRSHKLFE